MLSYILVLVIAVVALLVPRSRRAALSVLGITGIAAFAIAGIGLPVWALYEAKSWLAPPDTLVEKSLPKASEQGSGGVVSDGGEQAVSSDERAESGSIEDQQKRQAEEKQRVAGIAEAARAIVGRDRKYAAAAAAAPPLSGLAQVSADLIAIRVPSWRDKELAAREQGLIRAWLHTIGLTPEDTAGIYTANGWGSLYDLWHAEVLAEVEGPAPDAEQAEASVTEQPELEPAPRQAELPRSDEPRALFEPLPESVPKRLPESISRPPAKTPKKRAVQERAVGPFGY